MEAFSYVVKRDVGFAPNPFYGTLSLATCKAKLRKNRNVGDWIFGFGGADYKKRKQLVYAMKITDKMTFNDYWNHPDYQCKKPYLKGSLKQAYGDNIYFFNGENWQQSNSHHSLENGDVNTYNLNRDTGKTNFILLSKHFYYFGKEAIMIPNEFSFIIKTGIGETNVSKKGDVDKFIKWLESNHEPGYYAKPNQFEAFTRYNGL